MKISRAGGPGLPASRRRALVLATGGLTRFAWGAAALPLSVARTLSIDEALARLWPRTATVTFAPSTVRERRLMAQLIPAILRDPFAFWSEAGLPGGTTNLWAPRAREAGFAIEGWLVAGDRYLAVVEPPSARRGAGAYLFALLPPAAAPVSPGAATDVILQAPHAYYDRDTGKIAARMLFESRALLRPRAFFTNTVHRFQDGAGPVEPRPGSAADVCHNPQHVFSAATRAAAAHGGTRGGFRFIQIHGFASRTEHPVEAGTTAVVSAGNRAGSSPVTRAIAEGLRVELGDGVRRFPEDTAALGATTNVQGRLLAAFPESAFVHIELASDIRRRLLAEAPLRGRFADRVLGPVTG